MAFRWGADDGLPLVLFGSPSSKNQNKKMSELDPLWQNFLDLHMQPRHLPSLVSLAVPSVGNLKDPSFSFHVDSKDSDQTELMH